MQFHLFKKETFSFLVVYPEPAGKDFKVTQTFMAKKANSAQRRQSRCLSDCRIKQGYEAATP